MCLFPPRSSTFPSHLRYSFSKFDFCHEKKTTTHTKELQILDTQLHGLTNYLETSILSNSQ